MTNVRKAFTVLELLVVLSVLAILIGIALPRIKGMRDQGNITKAQSELKMIQLALESYYTNANPHAYPPSGEDGSGLTEKYLTLAAPQIISSVMYDPFVDGGTTEYYYTLSANGSYYCVVSRGLNKSGVCKAADDGTVAAQDPDDICVTNIGECKQ